LEYKVLLSKIRNPHFHTVRSIIVTIHRIKYYLVHSYRVENRVEKIRRYLGSNLSEKELKEILSEAYKKSQEIKGGADAESTKIYADAYNKDPEFFSFLKTLETYSTTVDENTTVILTTEGEYFKYLTDISP